MTEANHQRQMSFEDQEAALILFGNHNKNLIAIEKAIGATIQTRGQEVTLSGQQHEVVLTASLLDQLFDLLREGYPVYPSDITYAIRILQKTPKAKLKEIFLDQIYITNKRRMVTPKSVNQKKYIDAIRHNDIVFGIGPAGTGKTYLAVAMAVAALSKKQVEYIILARPAVEAGEKLGFLPGDLAQKINPYLRPLYDALNDLLGKEKALALIEQDVIEIAPLAFMRGRTLNNAFVILDEAQNTTKEQMKMFLTRLGFNSRAVVTGDVTQIDLPEKTHSGLIHASGILQKIKGISFCQLTENDVVRHPLVQKIIKAYGWTTVDG